MVEIQNVATQKEIRQALGLGPQQAPNSVTPVVNVNPKDYKDATVLGFTTTGSSGTQTIITASTSQDVYVTGFVAGYAKDAASDVASIAITCTVGGASKNLMRFAIIAATAQSDTISVTLRNPIKIDRNTSVVLTGTFTAGVLTRTVCVYGYESLPAEVAF